MAGASDTGHIFFIDPVSEDWYHFPPVAGVNNNWEGLTVDIGDNNTNHLYLVSEGNAYEHPQLTKIIYTLGQPNTCNSGTVQVVSVTKLTEITPYLTEEDGIESLTVYTPSTVQNPTPEFFVGVQKTGIIYSITGDNQLTGIILDHRNTRGRVSGSQYLPQCDILLVVGDGEDLIQAIDVSTRSVVQSWWTYGTNEEGIVLVGNKLYIADDSGGLQVHNFDIGICECTGTCPTASPSSVPSMSPTIEPSVSPTSNTTTLSVAPTTTPSTTTCSVTDEVCNVDSDCCSKSCNLVMFKRMNDQSSLTSWRTNHLRTEFRRCS